MILAHLFLSLALAFSMPAPAEPAQVDLMLMLATDVSGSITADEYELQKFGIVAALTDPEMTEVLAQCAPGGLAISYLEWADSPAAVVPFTYVNGQRGLATFAKAIAAALRTRGNGTNLAGALRRSADMMLTAPFEAPRHVIDISGDGPQNVPFFDANTHYSRWQGKAAVAHVRDQLVQQNFVINALVLDVPGALSHDTDGEVDLETYFTRHVVGGENSFTRVVHNFEEFSAKFRQKLKREICTPNS